MRIRSMDAGDFFRLPRGKLGAGIETEGVSEQALLAKNLMNPRDAAGEIVGGVEKGSVAVGDLSAKCEEVSGYRFCPPPGLALFELCHGGTVPAGPVTEQPTGNSQAHLAG